MGWLLGITISVLVIIGLVCDYIEADKITKW